MKTLLLLSSSQFLIENKLSEIFNKSFENIKLAHIFTAAKGKGCVKMEYLEKTKNILKAKGCIVEDLDIDGKNEDELRNILKNFDGVFVNGGSTFYLLKSIRESGFDKVLKELLPEGFIYIGASAGSYVCCPTIEMSLWKHQDKYDHYGMTDLTGMNLVPFLMSVHYVPENKELIKNKISEANYPVRILTDQQAILVKDDEITFLGGKEIKLD